MKYVAAGVTCFSSCLLEATSVDWIEPKETIQGWSEYTSGESSTVDRIDNPPFWNLQTGNKTKPLPTTVDLCHLCHEIEKDFSLVVEALEGAE